MKWKAHFQDILAGEATGGALLSLQRDLEVPPFIVCLVLKKVRQGQRLYVDPILSKRLGLKP